VAQPLGTGTVADSFAGDAVYRAASANASTTLFAFLSSGGFVVDDQSGHTGSKATFCDAQWSSNNSLTGGTAPSTFKGFADSLSAEPPVCAIAWTFKTANSSQPPSTVPRTWACLCPFGHAIGKHSLRERDIDSGREDRCRA
jgi:hypothetical protein